MGSDMGDAVVRAEKKLRQADFFLGHLESASREVRGSGPNPEALEFYFSACLTAAQSAYYVLDGAGGGSFKETQRDWRLGLPETERSRFGRTIGLRDDDVHLATTPTAPLPKYVEEDRSRYTVSHVPMLGPEAVVEMENPDGTKVRGPVLRGSIGLYIDEGGRRIDASQVCREFIGQLRSLLGAVKHKMGVSKS